MTAAPAIELKDIRKAFGGNFALDGVSFQVATGELIALVGPNGSGKTTLLNVLTGHLKPESGMILLDGHRVDGRRPETIARLGMIRMFQLTRLFRGLSVGDNLVTVGLATGLHRRRAGERAEWLLEQLALTPFIDSSSTALSGGQKKLLEFAMCFMAPARVVLLDEPFSAIAEGAKETMLRFLRARNQSGDTIIVVSHDIPIVSELCPRTICMSNGKVLAEGPTATVLSDDAVVEAYLGGAHA